MKVEVGTRMGSQERGETHAVTAADGEGKTVVVGVRMDARSNELLTWALVKVAQPGDRVVALHVLPNSAPSPAGAGPLQAFDSVLAVYEGFCHLKQVHLELKVCRGSSLRKVMVREAAAAGASSLILGINHNTHRIGSSPVSVAKYCAKKLSTACSVVAVSNGKVVFQREAAQAVGKCHGSKRKEKKRLSTTSIQNGSNDNLFCLLPDRNGSSGSSRMDPVEGRLSLPSVELEKSCSICSSAISEVEDSISESLSLVSASEIGSTPGSPSPSAQEGQQQQQAGWSALRWQSAHKRKPSFSDRTKASITQWVTRLPGRHFTAAASIHPDHKAPSADSDVPVAKTIDSVDLSMFSKELESVRDNYASKCREFAFEELSTATSSFAEENLIGKGGNSCVYKGCLSDGRELAVKVLKPSAEIVKDFILEIEVITTLHHDNVTSLLGFCFDDKSLILVYEFLSRGSLDQNLQDKTGNVLGWDRRHKVAVGVAQALDYLHSGGDTARPVIHRDVKSSNILLSEDFEPQLSDFGLATWSSSSSTLIPCNDVAGTFGYLAPEYFTIGQVNEKIDVYAFGVVLLELLTGRKPIAKDSSTKGQESLVLWAKPFLQNGKTKEMLDPSLGDEVDTDQVERVALAASLCTRRAPKLRPNMAHVLKLLQGDEEATESARCQVKTSEDVEEPNDDGDEDTSYPDVTDIQSHLSLALLDVEDEELSIHGGDSSSAMLQSSVEAYLQGRWSRSWSFD